MSITKIEVRIEAEPEPDTLSSTEIWEIEHMPGRKELKISCNGVFVASNTISNKPMDAAYEVMESHLTEAYNKLMTDAITSS